MQRKGGRRVRRALLVDTGRVPKRTRHDQPVATGSDTANGKQRLMPARCCLRATVVSLQSTSICTHPFLVKFGG